MTYPASITADVTVSTAAAVNSQLDAWEANWSGTVPAGKATGDERVIALDTSTSTEIDMSGRSFPQMVWLRSAGTFTDYDCSVKVSAVINMESSSNVGLYLMHVIGGNRVRINNSSSCAVTRCFIQGSDTETPESYTFGANYVVDINNASNCEFEDCVIGWGINPVILKTGSNSYITFKGCVFDWNSHDSMKNTSTLTYLTVENCWFSRNIRAIEGSTYHEDMFQQSGGSTNGAVFRGNVGLLDQNRWSGGSTGSWQGLFFGDGYAGINCTCEQNIFASNNGVIKWSEGSSEAGTISRYNTAVHVTNGSLPASIVGGTASYNWTMSYNPAVTTNGAGTNGICVDVDDLTSKNLTEANTYFTHGCPVEGDPIGHYEPATGTAMHWNYGGTKVGAYQRFEELFSLGGSYVPGNVGWPVAGTWEPTFNDVAPKLTTTWDGTYDADGENGGEVTPAAPEITGVPTISGTENVGQILTATAGSRTGYPTPTRTWQWYDTVSGAISGATSSTLTIPESAEGHAIYVIQTETNTTDPFTDTAQSSNTGTIGAVLSAPTISTLSPADNATGVSRAVDFVATFNQDIQFGTGTITLWRAGAVRETWDVETDVGTGPHKVSISGAVLTINTMFDMLIADYSIRIDAGAIENLSGASFAGISDDTTWNFSTAENPTAGRPALIGGNILLANGLPLITS